MRYNPRARLDRSQVENRRGRGGGGGGMGFPLGGRGGGGGGLRVGGGIGGLVVLVIIVLLSSQLGGGGGGGGGTPGGQTENTSLDQCRTGVDANQDEDCALVADVNSIQSYWSAALPRQSRVQYTEARTTIFSGGVRTEGCGSASSDVGPFYCPVDKNVYLDTTFFEDMLQKQLGAKGGQFAQSYVLSHEYGHHVQNLLGTMGRVRTQQGERSDAVRLELQADCYAGMWTKHATSTEDAGGEPYILDLTQDDIALALGAAAAVGDDRIQRRSSGRVDPDSWTHGSAEQRMRWFTVGMEKGTLRACDTFAANRL